SVQLTASAGTSYLWSTNETTADVTVTTSGTYTVTVTASGSCVAISNPLNVVVNPNPVVSLSGNADLVCSNALAFVLTEGSPAGGAFSGTGVIGNSFDPSVAGAGNQTITYTYTDNNGCSNIASEVIEVTVCSGLTDLADWSSNISPNPSSGHFELTLQSDVLRKMDVTITNTIGQKVYEQKNISVSNTFSEHIDLERSSGVYYMAVTSGNNKHTYKLIVQ
ncbi:MAG: T9SS type A sorting domain-containing protein, partial [Bacteroidota bacterium]